METEVLREELQDKIAHADQHQVEKIYGLVINYLNSQDDFESESKLMNEPTRKEILKSLEQAKSELGKDARSAIGDIRKKYGLNG